MSMSVVEQRLSVNSLTRGPSFELVATQWCREIHPLESEGCLSYGAIEFMGHGSFRKRQWSRDSVGDTNSVTLFFPGVPYRVTHPTGNENAGGTIRLETKVFREVVRRGLAVTAGGHEYSCATTRLDCSAQLFFQLQTLLYGLRCGGKLDQLEINDRVMVLVDSLLDNVQPATDSWLPNSRQRSKGCRLLDVVEMMNASFDQALTLEDLASTAECSTWHLARMFRRHIGIPVYRYLKRLRLRHALMEIADGCGDLSRLALNSGFSDHSHLTSAFRREFGCTPKAARKRLTTK